MYGDTDRGGAASTLRFVTCDLSSLTDCGCMTSASSHLTGSSNKRKTRSSGALIDPDSFTALSAKRLLLGRPTLIDRLISKNKSALEEMEGKKRGPGRPAMSRKNKIEPKEALKRKRTSSLNGTSPAIKRLRSAKEGSDSDSSESRNTSIERRRGRPPLDKSAEKKSPKKPAPRKVERRFSVRIYHTSLRSGKKRKNDLSALKLRRGKNSSKDGKGKRKWTGLDKTDSNSNVCENHSNDEVDDSTDSEMSRGTSESSELTIESKNIDEKQKSPDDEIKKRRRRRQKRDSMWVRKVKKQIKAKVDNVELNQSASSTFELKVEEEEDDAEEEDISESLETSDIPVLDKVSDDSLVINDTCKLEPILNVTEADDVAMPKLEKEVDLPSEKSESGHSQQKHAEVPFKSENVPEKFPDNEGAKVPTEDRLADESSFETHIHVCSTPLEKKKLSENDNAVNHMSSEENLEREPETVENESKELKTSCEENVSRSVAEQAVCTEKENLIENPSNTDQHLTIDVVEESELVIDEERITSGYDSDPIVSEQKSITESTSALTDQSIENDGIAEGGDIESADESIENGMKKITEITSDHLDDTMSDLVDPTIHIKEEELPIDPDSTSDVKPNLDDSFNDFSLSLPDDLYLDSSISDDHEDGSLEEQSDSFLPDSTVEKKLEDSQPNDNKPLTEPVVAMDQSFLPVNQFSVNSAPVDQILVNSTPLDQTSVNSPPLDQILVNSTPLDQFQVKPAPIDQLSVNSYTVDQNPVDSVPAIESLVNSVPAVELSQINSVSIVIQSQQVNSVPVDQFPLNSGLVDRIPLNSVPADQILSNSVPADQILSNSVPADQILSNSVPADQIQGHFVPADQIQTDSIDKCPDNSVFNGEVETFTERRVELNGQSKCSDEAGIMSNEELVALNDNHEQLDPKTAEDTLKEILGTDKSANYKREELTFEQRQMKESVLQALGLKSLTPQQPEEKPKRDGYTGTLKAVIKLNRTGDKKRMVYRRSEDSMGELEYRICSEIPATDGVPITHLNDIASIRKNVSKQHHDSDPSTTAFHGTTTSNGHAATSHEDQETNNQDDSKGQSAGKESNLIIPEKSSSFSIHPGRLCSDVCTYCFGKFGCLDTPCHVAQLKSERQKKILENEPHLTLESCLCDACYRYVDRKANCPSKGNTTGKNKIRPPASSQCCVNDCSLPATHTVKKKWLVKLKKSITNKVQSDKLDIDLDKSAAMYFPLCAQHHYWVEYFTVCGICRKRLNRNHLYSLGTETDRLNLMLAEDGIPARLSDKLFLCKLCRYYSNLRLKYADPGAIPSNGRGFYRDYRRKILMSLDIPVSDSEEEHIKEEKKKGLKKPSTDGSSSTNGASTSRGETEEESVMSLSNLATLLGDQPEQQARIQVKFGNVNIGRLSNLNIGQGGREERSPYSDVGLQANLEFQGPAVPDGSWERCTSNIQFDKRTKKLWQDLQKPYGNQSSFLRHLVMLEKYWRAGYLNLSSTADERAAKYLNGVRNRIKAFEGITDKPSSTAVPTPSPTPAKEKFPLITNTGEIEVTPLKAAQKKVAPPPVVDKKPMTHLDRAKSLVRMIQPTQRFPSPMQRYPVPMYVPYNYPQAHHQQQQHHHHHHQRPPPLLKIRSKMMPQTYYSPLPMQNLKPILPKLPRALTVTQVPQGGSAITLNRAGITIEKQSGSPVMPALPIEKPSISVFREPAPGPP